MARDPYAETAEQVAEKLKLRLGAARAKLNTHAYGTLVIIGRSSQRYSGCGRPMDESQLRPIEEVTCRECIHIWQEQNDDIPF